MKFRDLLESYTGRRKVPVTLLILSIFLTTPILTACGPSNGTGLSVGDPSPEFSLPSASGEQVSLSDFRGSKAVLLYFHMADG
jgi:hypothetical protein